MASIEKLRKELWKQKQLTEVLRHEVGQQETEKRKVGGTLEDCRVQTTVCYVSKPAMSSKDKQNVPVRGHPKPVHLCEVFRADQIFAGKRERFYRGLH